jgi:hypothetical protein
MFYDKLLNFLLKAYKNHPDNPKYHYLQNLLISILLVKKSQNPSLQPTCEPTLYRLYYNQDSKTLRLRVWISLNFFFSKLEPNLPNYSPPLNYFIQLFLSFFYLLIEFYLNF